MRTPSCSCGIVWMWHSRTEVRVSSRVNRSAAASSPFLPTASLRPTVRANPGSLRSAPPRRCTAAIYTDFPDADYSSFPPCRCRVCILNRPQCGALRDICLCAEWAVGSFFYSSLFAKQPGGPERRGHACVLRELRGTPRWDEFRIRATDSPSRGHVQQCCLQPHPVPEAYPDAVAGREPVKPHYIGLCRADTSVCRHCIRDATKTKKRRSGSRGRGGDPP
ncbi:hypothetical protein OH76DRAFT_1034011 [Lentinus brumalis]|uniref:Uncharacterized protein n=1 Tax=Lentinus brumalis TaxID=2498619 RepID=A0A371CX23_9APHY|nr:hypothetical protein OH76DRAFT_1034011 [Polyporus brumalis]